MSHHDKTSYDAARILTSALTRARLVLDIIATNKTTAQLALENAASESTVRRLRKRLREGFSFSAGKESIFPASRFHRGAHCRGFLRDAQKNRGGHTGAAERGAAERGTAERGAAERGAAERGAAERGAAERGTAERGAAERGAARGAAARGAARR